jgi:hypothetical protein
MIRISISKNAFWNFYDFFAPKTVNFNVKFKNALGVELFKMHSNRNNRAEHF